MAGFRLRRALWMLLVGLVAGVVIFYAAQQLTITTSDRLDRTAAVLLQWRKFLEEYGFWLHLSAHGLTYLYLILCWPRLIRWVDRRRVARGHVPSSPTEQRRLTVAVIAVCVAYESLLMLRYLD